ncbi:hypothetical protein DCAR_0312212 [Daucus carota subsp. sativus]|uniref:Uncharacterized protein n=1 Tax=Daucus carota subsp. sativus TaxID=79200 RepID=A0A166AVK1_DAUCS|nr:hypothetical protein DCAR_0312212 [Daucus carota subsp. sativus]
MAGRRVVDGRGGGGAGCGGGRVGQVGCDGNDDPAIGRDRSNGGSGGGHRGGRGYAEDPNVDLMDDDNDAARGDDHSQEQDEQCNNNPEEQSNSNQEEQASNNEEPRVVLPNIHRGRGYSAGLFGNLPSAPIVTRIANNEIEFGVASRTLLAIMRRYWPDDVVSMTDMDRMHPGWWNLVLTDFGAYINKHQKEPPLLEHFKELHTLRGKDTLISPEAKKIMGLDDKCFLSLSGSLS